MAEDSGHMTFPDGEDGDLLREFVGQYEVGDSFELRVVGTMKDVSDEGFSFSIESASSDEFIYDDDETAEDEDDLMTDADAGTGEDSGDAIIALLGADPKEMAR